MAKGHCRPWGQILLLEFDGCASLLKFCLGGFGLILGHAFQDRCRGTFNQTLRLGQAQTGLDSTYGLDDLNFLAAITHQDDIKLSFLLSRAGIRAFTTACSRNRNRGSSTDTPFFFQFLDQFGGLKDRQTTQLFHYFCYVCHCFFSFFAPGAPGI